MPAHYTLVASARNDAPRGGSHVADSNRYPVMPPAGGEVFPSVCEGGACSAGLPEGDALQGGEGMGEVQSKIETARVNNA